MCRGNEKERLVHTVYLLIYLINLDHDIMSPRHRLCGVMVGLVLLDCLYVLSFREGTSLIAQCWTFSILVCVVPR